MTSIVTCSTQVNLLIAKIFVPVPSENIRGLYLKVQNGHYRKIVENVDQSVFHNLEISAE